MLAQYKLGTNEDNEDYQFRCKSLATIYNYFKIHENEVRISDYNGLREFLVNEEKYTTEHFVISQSRKREVKVEIGRATVDYEIEEKIYNSYVNSIFNFIYIPRQLNSDLGNNWLPAKTKILRDYPAIACNYSKMVVSKATELSDSLSALPLTMDNYTDKLYVFFAREFREKYIEYSRDVLQSVIEQIKA